MYSDDIEKQAKLAFIVNKLMKKCEKLLEDQELQLQPTKGLVPWPKGSEKKLPNRMFLTAWYYNQKINLLF